MAFDPLSGEVGGQIFPPVGNGGGSSTTPISSWASRPASPSLNQQIMISDLSMSAWYWDGTAWRPNDGVAKLKATYGSNATPLITLTGNGTDFGVDLFTIPAGLIPKNSAVRISIMAKRLNGATALSNLNARIGPTGVIGDQSAVGVVVGASGGFSYGGSQIQFDTNGVAARQNYQLSQGGSTYPNMAMIATDLTAIDRSLSQKIKLWMTSDWVLGNSVAIYSIEVDIFATN